MFIPSGNLTKLWKIAIYSWFIYLIKNDDFPYGHHFPMFFSHAFPMVYQAGAHHFVAEKSPWFEVKKTSIVTSRWGPDLKLATSGARLPANIPWLISMVIIWLSLVGGSMD